MPTIKSYRQLIDEANAQIRTLTLEQAREELERGEALFVDLRDVRELEREGIIPGAFHAPRGMLEFWVDPSSPYFKPVFKDAAEHGRPMVLFCAGGWRSALSARALQEMGFVGVSHIDGGFSAWKKAGLPVGVREPHHKA